MVQFTGGVDAPSTATGKSGSANFTTATTVVAVGGIGSTPFHAYSAGPALKLSFFAWAFAGSGGTDRSTPALVAAFTAVVVVGGSGCAQTVATTFFRFAHPPATPAVEFIGCFAHASTWPVPSPTTAALGTASNLLVESTAHSVWSNTLC